MTFLVGLVGLDGVLLAADMKHARRDEKARNTFGASKIFISSDKRLAYCSSGDEIANEVGTFLLEKLRVNGSDQAFSSNAISLVREFVSWKPIDPFDRQGTILMTRYDEDVPQLWRVSVSNQHSYYPQALRIRDKICEGDKGNLASFIGEVYFPSSELIPITRLRLLAAHSILMAGKLNNQFIGGVEIAESTSKGFEKLADIELAELRRLSDELYVYNQNALLKDFIGS